MFDVDPPDGVERATAEGGDQLPLEQMDGGSARRRGAAAAVFRPPFVEDEIAEQGERRSVIVIEGMAGHVSTALVASTLDDTLNICHKLNRRLGYDREAWTAMVAASMRAEDDDPDGGAWH